MIRAMDELNAFLGRHGIRFFSAGEVVQLGRMQHGETITMPPEDIWWRIIPTLTVMDRVREAVGPIRVLSGYRPEGYNRAVGGAQRSLHVAFNALDTRPWHWEDWTVDDYADVVMEAGGDLIERYGGLGVYQDSNPHDQHKTGFVHVDTRAFLGMDPAHWHR